ncbi:Gfo/Idh/MocA family oxidoreductase [Halobacterium bonnevillei]|uniref:Gfo/Idh/MocA family oxidoreductase n=1 Tax=Halobacterium bonnevillei TaxID=2692200 RepID=A0A6B0SL52_9EURY|nr:Gfo/Idh/MocA family oxidoreductase [Halobacterium bonnevillei]MXR19610.1 Gfo/Idh/MocA family oxidoreductase [Halobacterium bonnevillei]
MTRTPLRTGVVGVGSMGRNHARVYRELAGTTLVGVADADPAAADSVATEYEAEPYATAALLDHVDAVSVAVPTPFHASVVERCIEAGVDVLVEKPFVEDPQRGRELAAAAEAAGVVIQVGHVERFNPAVRTLASIVPDLDVMAVTADRLSPPDDRDIGDGVVYDLMIHDIDVVCSLLDADPVSLSATRAADGEYATATCQFDGGVLASLTASRVTQQKVRKLAITARECRVTLDFLDQSVEIHRSSTPEYVSANGDLRHRVESVIERPLVEHAEPLKRELAAFADAVRDGTDPVVTADDGVRAVEIASRIADGIPAEDHREVRQ